MDINAATETEVGLRLLLRNVSKTYGDHQVNAVSDVSLEIKGGDFIALMGPSGCGKSTLLNLIGAIDKPLSGEILFNATNIVGKSDDELTKFRSTEVGYIFQFFNLLSTLSVYENVALPLQLQKRKSKEIELRVGELLERVQLTARKTFYPSELSGGEMQRVAIARALVHAPKLILADEPTGNLDTVTGQAILSLLQEINQSGTTILMATHSEDAARYAASTIQMRDGKVVQTVKNAV